MPHYSTWSRVLAYAVDPVQMEQVLGQFFAAGVGKSAQPQRGRLALCLDGKTLRGTIPLGESRGVQLLAAYVPEQGIVLAQVRVEETTNEQGLAPHLLELLDLRGVVVSGDALFDQRNLSVQIVQAGGDSVWTTKDNQADLREEIETLFQPQQARPGWSLPPTDFRTATSVNKGHGRLEQRTLTTSSMLAHYSSWPALAQVFKLESQTTNALGHTQGEVRYGLISLPAWLVSPQQLLELVRGHWRIENGLHYRRDATMREDHSQLRMGHAPHLLAILNTTVVGLVARQGRPNLAEARREFAYQFDKALAALAA